MKLESAADNSRVTNESAKSQEITDDINFEVAATAPGEFRVIRRNGKVTVFDGTKIKVALTKAFLAVEGNQAAASTRVHELVEEIGDKIVAAVTRHTPAGGAMHIEDIQDQVELALMRTGERKVARAYVLYREERARERSLV